MLRLSLVEVVRGEYGVVEACTGLADVRSESDTWHYPVLVECQYRPDSHVGSLYIYLQFTIFSNIYSIQNIYIFRH